MLRRLREGFAVRRLDSQFHFAWDPKNNPEQRRLSRAALIAGGLGVGAAALGVLGHRRGWFNPVPAPSRPALPLVPPVPAPKVAAPVTPPTVSAKPPPAVSQSSPKPPPASVTPNPPARNPAAAAELGKLVAKMKKAGPSKPSSTPSPVAPPRKFPAKRGPADPLPAGAVGHLAALHEATKRGPNAAARRAAAEALRKLQEKHGIVHTTATAPRRKSKVRVPPDPFRKPNRIIEDAGDRPGGRVPRYGSVVEETERQMAARWRARLLERGDQARKLLWPAPPRWWKGRVPAMPPRGSTTAKRLAEDLRWAYRFRNARGAGSGEIYGKIGKENARKAILRGGVTEVPSTPGATWIDSARPQQLRMVLHDDRRERTEFLADEIRKVASVAVPAAVELIPGGTAINAAGLAGLRTAIAFRRLKRTKFGPGVAGYGRAVLEPGSVAAMLGQASQTGVRDSRAFLKKVVRKLPAPAQVLNTKLFAAEPIPGALLRARQQADCARARRLQLAHCRLFRMGSRPPAIEFGGREQMKDIHDNTWANPAAAAMGTQQVYIRKDREGNPIPMKVTLRHAQVGRYLWNRAAKTERPLRRGFGLVRDVKDVVAGNPRRTDSRGRPRPREWEKAWFKRGLAVAGLTAAGLGGLAYMKHFPSRGPGLPGRVRVPFTKKTVPVGEALPPKVRDARLPSRDAILGQVDRIKDKVNQYTPDFFPKRREFRARFRRILLDVTGGEWDVRDARGRSARVFAGNSSPRDRRRKYWWEKVHNQRVIAAVAAPALLAAGVAGGRALKGHPLSSLNPFRNPFAMPAPGTGGNVIRNTPPPVRRPATA